MIKKHCKKTIDVLFETQVSKTPHQTALQSDQGSLTYKQLNEKANQLAHYLKSQGIGPEQVVALHLDRSIEAIIAILAVLKAGGAYLPLNTCDPINRIRLMLKESDTKLLITQSTQLLNSMPTSTCQSMAWKQLQVAIQNKLVVTPKQQAKMDNLAYIIYTSGSTGRPKGVEIEHKSLPNMVKTHIKWYELNSSSRALEFSSLHFDASVSEIFTALLSGATLYIPSNDIRPNPERLSDYITKNKITVASIPPVLLNHMKKPPDFHLKTLVVAGDTCPKKTMDYWKKHCRVINGYGPTESTVCATLFLYDGTDNRCIGQAIDNIQCYVLNKRLKEVSSDEIGELYIGGIGLARGYCNQPQLTKEKFIQWTDKKNHGKKIRLYRTGDRVRLLNNGCLHYVGRADFQIKFNGRRLEPGEIENTLNQHPAVQQSLVVLRQHNHQSYLIAYVVKKKKTLSKDRLKQYLNSKLSAITTPNIFIFLERFPLLASGKINRRKLPPPKFESITDKNSAKLTENEQFLQKIWVEVLHLKSDIKIGKKSDFFSLGGTSLQAGKLISIIQDSKNINFSLPDIFENPTLEKLAIKLQLSRIGLKKTCLVTEKHPADMPLSFSQRRVWLAYQMMKHTCLSGYNLKLSLIFKGKLNLVSLKNALQCLINRHEILRTYFPSIGVQRIGYFQVDLKQYKVPSYSKNNHASIKKIIDKIAAHGFMDLSKLPLLSASLIEVKDDYYILVIIFHHIIFDESAVPIFINDLKDAYNAYAKNEAYTCIPLSMQYSDFSLYQHKQLQSGAYDKSFHYWKKQLSGATNQLNLPHDNKRPKMLSHRGRVHLFKIPEQLLSQLETFARQQKVTIFTLLFSSIAILLYRYTRQNDFTIGLAYNKHRNLDMEPLIGLFLNMLPIRVKFGQAEIFVETLCHLKLILLEAYQHSAPVEVILDKLKLPKDPSMHPLFQVAVIIHDLPKLNLDFTGLKTSLLDKSLITASNLHSSKFDLTFEMEVLNKCIAVKIEYATDLFVSDTIKQIARSWLSLCRSIVAQSRQPIDTLPLLSQTEEKQILAHWGRLGRCYSKKKNILQLFLEQVKKTPNSVAIIDQGKSISYKELDKKSNQLANYILTLEDLSSTERIIAVALNGSLNFIISLLAILKTGSAYLPLDPELPSKRLEFMIKDSNAVLVITYFQYRQQFKHLKNKVLFLNAEETIQTLRRQSTANPNKNIDSHQLAYVIYTSGSTGKPKGVMIEHNSVVQLAKVTPYIHLNSSSIIAQVCNVTFDVSGFEIWGGLLNGSKLIICPKEFLLDVRAFGNLIGQYKINTLILPTALFYQFLISDVTVFQFIEWTIFIGEKLQNIRPLEKLIHLKPKMNRRIINVYGPTEDTVFSTTYTITSKSLRGDELPIGKPIPDTLTYVLDKQLKPVPIGVTGELFLGGLGLARGYLNREELTKERFISNQYLTNSSRLYRTGDRVRYNANGDIIFLGRLDYQVKISGYRVELSEIEKTIAAQPNIKEVLVITQEINEKKVLLAYVSLKTTKSLQWTQRSLRDALSKILPHYMVPHYFIILKKFPLTPSGKLNRQALPPVQKESHKAKVYAAPQKKTEAKLLAIWKDVLKITKKISIDDNFFELGGTSLFAMELNHRINTELKAIPYYTLFSEPTVRAQSELIDMPSGAILQPKLTIDFLKQESQLDASIGFQKNNHYINKQSMKNILLTGVTGFLGIFLLEELLNTTQATIYCLIRAKNKQNAENRLHGNMQKYKLNNLIKQNRIKIIVGDIAQDRFSLSKNTYEKLSKKIDVIYHAASVVNFMQPYSALQNINVRGTERIIRFATIHKAKILHYISSAAVFSFAHYFNHKRSYLLEKPLCWNESLYSALPKDLGYTQSKAVAETLVWNAHLKGLTTNIYRIGFLLCHSKTGIGNIQQLWSMLAKDCLASGYYPVLNNLKGEFITVDYAAKAIIQISTQSESLNKIFHVVPPPENNITTNQLFTWLSTHNQTLKPEAYTDWIIRLKNYKASKKGGNMLELLMPLFISPIQDGLTLLEVYQNSPHYSVKNTKQALKKINIIDGALNPAIMKRYFNYLTK